MNKQDKIYVAGHRGMVGSAIVRRLQADGFTNIVTRTSKDLNLIDQQAVRDFFAQEKPAYVFLAAPVCSSYITGEVLPVLGGETVGSG